MTNEQLVARIKAGEDVAENMAQLYDQVKKFIHAAALRYRGSEELEDLEQEGYLALYPAIDGYDPDQGVKFLTYANYHIKQRIRRYLQTSGSCVRLPVHCREQIAKYNRFCASFMAEYGRMPTDFDSAACMGLTLEQIGDIKESARMARLGSLDGPVKGLDDGEGITVGDMIASDEDLEGDVVDRMESKQLCTVLWECVDTLPDRQPDIIRKRYRDNMTLESIGQVYGVSKDAIRQQERKALRALRKPKHSKRLRPYLPEAEIYSMGLTGNGVGRFDRTWTSSTERAALKVMDWEERRREHLEWLDAYWANVAMSQ